MVTNHQRKTFISYSRVNTDFALRLAKELKSGGYTVWLDQLDIPTGSRWDNELEKALDECEIFLLILTPAAIASENVKDEIGYAIDSKKRILPLMLETCNVPLRLRRIQFIDFTTLSFDNGIDKAKQQLDLLLTEPTISREDVQVEEKHSAGETAARIVMRRTASNRYISERTSVIEATTLLTQGKQLSQKDDWLGAAQAFRKVLELIPNHGETKTLLAEAEAQIVQTEAQKVKSTQPAPPESKSIPASPTGETISLDGLRPILLLVLGPIGGIIDVNNVVSAMNEQVTVFPLARLDEFIDKLASQYGLTDRDKKTQLWQHVHDRAKTSK